MSRKIESQKVVIHRKAEEIYSFLSNFNNFTRLMPEQVSNWRSDEDSCSFEIKGLASLAMRITEKIPFSRIVMQGEGKLPFAFSLISDIEAQSDASIVQLFFDAEISAFTAMVVEKPMTAFVDLLAGKLKEQLEADNKADTLAK